MKNEAAIRDTLECLADGKDVKKLKCYNYSIIRAIIKAEKINPMDITPAAMQKKINQYRKSHPTKADIQPITLTENQCISFLKSKGYRIYKLQEVAV